MTFTGTTRPEDLEQAARVVAPWSSDPLDEVEWTANPDGSVTVFPAEDGA